MDNEVAISQAQAAIPSAAGHYHRLIAVVDESPTPTSDLGVKASERIGCERVVLGMELPPLLLPLSVRQRKLRTPQLVDQLVSSRTGDVVVVDRIEVLFDRSLEINALKCLLKAVPSAAQMTAAGTAGSLSPRIILRHALGTEHVAVGSTVATGTSSTSFAVQAGDGVNFRKGTFILVTISGEPEWTEITNISTDTLTVSPALSTTPSTSAVVRNLYCYAPAESHSNSLTVSQAFVGDAAARSSRGSAPPPTSRGWSRARATP
jgi:hypothetical protein